jgi:hypothetical protein
MRRVDGEDPPRIETFSRDRPLDSAEARYHARRDAEPTVQVWAETMSASGIKCYHVGPHELLWKKFMDSDSPKSRRIGDEVYFDSEPGRLAFDLDGKNMTPDDMKTFVSLIRDKVLAALNARFGLTDVIMREVDGSRAEKQSRHLFFDGAVFADIRNMERFITTDIMPGLPVPDGLVDLAIYGSRSRCLRLPLAAKFGEDRVLAPLWTGVVFDFARTMVNVLPEHLPAVLLTMPLPPPAQLVGLDNAVANIMRYLQQWDPVRLPPRADNALRFSLRNLTCLRKGAVHQSNNGRFTCGFGRDRLEQDCVLYSYFRCYDPDCNRMYWRPRTPIEYIAFPHKLQPQPW